MTDTEKHTAVITGASSGIGRAIALEFAGRGYAVVLAARGADALNAVAEECLAGGAPQATAVPTDIAEREQVVALFDRAVAEHGRIDVAVQNAAVAGFGRFTDIPADVFDHTIAVNVLGAANVARCALERFDEQGGGQLVVIGSLLGHTAVPYMSPYVMSKFAITALVRGLRQEARTMPGVLVHGMYPGAVDTPVYSRSANYFGRRAKVPPMDDPPAKIARAVVRRVEGPSLRAGRSGLPFEVTPAQIAHAVSRATTSRRSSERQIGLGNWPMLLAYRIVPRLFDALADPLMRLFSFGGESAEASPGNVYDSQE